MNQIVNQTRSTQAQSPRVEAERSQRRRRDDMGPGRHRNLSIAGMQDPRYTYRWVNSDPGRVHQLTVADDWDLVTTNDLGETAAKDKGSGTGVERIVDKRSGKTAVLVRKLTEYYTADKGKEQALIDETEQTMRRGAVVPVSGISGETLGASAYVPSGGIAIQSGARS